MVAKIPFPFIGFLLNYKNFKLNFNKNETFAENNQAMTTRRIRQVEEMAESRKHKAGKV